MRQPWTPRWPDTPTFWSVARPRLSFDRASVSQLAWPIAILVICCLLIGVASGLVAPSPASRASTEPSAPLTPAVSQVLSYALAWRGPDEDPPVVLPSGVAAKASNYRGVEIDGTTYYYNLAPRPSFDPLARGELTSQQVQIVAVVGDPPNRVMIYVRRCQVSGVGC
jgi:hypothetical protein